MSQYPKVPGLYEQPITQSLSEELEAVESELKVIEHIHSDTAPYILGQLLYERFVHALSSLPAKEKLRAQVEATNQILRLDKCRIKWITVI